MDNWLTTKNINCVVFLINGLQHSTQFPVNCAYHRPGLSPVNAALKVPANFQAATIGKVSGARGLAALPNGDLLVGTGGANMYMISNADALDLVGPVTTFATFPIQSPSSGATLGPEDVAFDNKYIFASTEKTIWRMSYKRGQKTGTPISIGSVRTSSIAPHSDGDVHHSTSIIVSGQAL